MKKFTLILVAVASMILTSCNVYTHSMREPNVRVELTAADFELSEQFTAEAEITKIFCVDWARLFGVQEMGTADAVNVASIPVIGNLMVDKAASYAMYTLMKEHPGYDVVVYPQVEKHKKAPLLGTDIYSTTTVKVTARLGKLKQ